jgi:molybdopterin-containing oxidoreductase family iron-sulfur binding subunit
MSRQSLANGPTQEFAPGTVETPPSDDALFLSRRGLLGAMASTLALVGAEGCRRPVERIVPYTKMPEDVIPGVPAHYATVLARRRDAVGLIVESHEGRPTKIEGNEAHPSSLGAVDLIAQATILNLYDPERSTVPRRQGRSAAWADFDAELTARLAVLERDGGDRLRVLMPPTVSPSVRRLRRELLRRFPRTRVHSWAPVDDWNVHEGIRLAFGAPFDVLYGYDRARVILSLDCDFLQTESGSVRASKMFASGRRTKDPRDTLNRLYVVEPSRTTTGDNADHRLRLPAARVEQYVCALASELGKRGVALGDLRGAVAGRAAPEGVSPKWLTAVADDLVLSRGQALVVVGSRQPPIVHAIAHAINVGLGATNHTVLYLPPTDDDGLNPLTDVGDLVSAMSAGLVDTLVILGGNPVYDAPGDLAFADKLASVPLTVHASLFVDETSERCTWHLPVAHEFESWGDAQSLDGTVSIQQPLIAPLYSGRSPIELLAVMGSAPERSGYDIVRATDRLATLAMWGVSECPAFDASGRAVCRDRGGREFVLRATEIENGWTRALATGISQRAPATVHPGAVRHGELAAVLRGRATQVVVGPESLEVAFAPCPKMFDGCHANNTWLQELPDPVTKLVWDNAATVSASTAKHLGVASGDRVRIDVGGRSAVVAVWIVAGHADHSIGLTLGWGRRRAGRIGNGRGFDVYPLRATHSLDFAVGARVAKVGGEPHFFARTQEHDSTEGRPIAPEATLSEYREKGNFAEQEAPPQRSLPLWPQQDYGAGHQWGMTVDLNACTGCSACVVACMAENNVPVVGKLEVWRGREMHWIRIDRYYVERPERGATAEDSLVVHEPVMCVHCEEAPCENVCPVNATVHGPEGLNEMAYNRCIGTRYCANNCPYKVRRFNYLNWHNDSVWRETGGLPETLQMQQNPNVTVRFRGVMEKCTYCVQRIQSAKLAAKRDGRPVRDREIRTACQQTCPSDAIVFGDVNDPASAVSIMSRIDRRFSLLGELGTRPRTTYLGKVRNPNPEMK